MEHNNFFNENDNKFKNFQLPKPKLYETNKITNKEIINDHIKLECKERKIIDTINGFKLPSDKEHIKFKEEQLVGYLSRKSRTSVTYKDNNGVEWVGYKEANKKFMFWIEYKFGQNSVMLNNLNSYKYKIENPFGRIYDLGKELIDDYNYEYSFISREIYETKSQINLVKLEQLFIQNQFPSCYIEELTKPNTNQNYLNWINFVINAEKKNVNINLLKDYFDELLQYLFNIPKNIRSVNNLNLPLSNFEINQIESIDQYASYFNRSSMVSINYFNKNLTVSNEIANRDVMMWFKSLFNKDSDKIQKLEIYRSKIECPSEFVLELGNDLIGNYNSKSFTLKQIYLIYLEQYLIRYKLESNFVYKFIDKKIKKNLDENVKVWISEITNNDRKKIDLLKQYLDEYFFHVLDKEKDKAFNNDFLELDDDIKLNNRKKRLYNYFI